MRIEGMVPQQLISSTQLPGILQRLEPGDVIRAQILDMVVNELLLRLPDGTTFTATPQVPLDASPGNFLSLRVKQRADHQLVMETMKDKSAMTAGKQDEYVRQLAAAGIAADEKSVEIAREMSRQGMTINRGGYEAVKRLLEQHGGLTPDKAAFLAAAGIQEDSVAFGVLDRMLEPEAGLGTGIKKLADSLMELIKPLSAEGNKGAGSLNMTSRGEQTAAPILSERQGEVPGTAASTELLQAGIQQQRQDISSLSAGHLEQEFKQLGQELRQILVTEDTFPSPVNLTGMDTGSVQQNGNLPAGKNFPSLEDSRETATFIRLKEAEQQLESMFVQGDLKELKEAGSAKRYYTKLLDTLDHIQALLSGLDFQGREPFLQRMEQLQNAARFLEQASSFHSYFQIPLNLGGSQTSAELYILRGKNRKKPMDPENMTLYLSLQTGNLGRVDSLLTITGKNISINMRTGTQPVLDFLHGNSTGLYQRIQEAGYKLVNISYRVREEETNMLNVREYASTCREEARYTFDFRV